MRLIIPAVILVTPLAAFSKDETGTPSGGLAFREEPVGWCSAKTVSS